MLVDSDDYFEHQLFVRMVLVSAVVYYFLYPLLDEAQNCS